MDIREKIRVIDGFPEPGISFKDITTLLRDADAFQYAINQMVHFARSRRVDVVVGPEARGFVIGAPVAYALGAGFVPLRKPGKLPAATIKKEYALEYGKDGLEIHRDALSPGDRVLIVDDLLATGGTVRTAVELVEELGAIVVGACFVIELTELCGRDKLTGCDVYSVVSYD